MKKITVTDIINVENIKKWESGDTIVISAGTGTGKSHFIKNRLAAFASSKNKKILFLIHRSRTVGQFRAEIEREGKSHIVDVRTYQSLEAKLRKNEKIDFSEYAYIVSDEFHYFLSDSAFNKFTDMSLRAILDTNTAVKIFMSATGDDTLKYIENIEKANIKEKYSISSNYDYINSINFYNNVDTLKELMYKWIENGEKALIFIQSDSKAYDLYREFEEYSVFNCSKNNKDYYRYVDEEKIEEILSNEKFENQFLITTTAMDAGVNIIDLELHNIVVDIKNTGSLIQAVGRKRIQNSNDTVNLYVKNIIDKELNLMKGDLGNRIKMAKFLKDNGDKKFIEEYYRRNDNSGIIYLDSDFTLRINKLMYNNTLISMLENSCMKNKAKNGYAKFILEKFGKENDEVVVLEGKKRESSIEEYLEKLFEDKVVMLTKDDRTELVEKIDARANGRRLSKIGSLNSALDELNIPYRICEFMTNRVIDGKKKKFKAAWKIDKIFSY